jgi:hypothetical protein
MLRSPAWRSLSAVARSIFLELAGIYNGGNNGFIALSTRDAAKHVRCSKDTAARALAELIEKGFIVCYSRGHFDRESPHASENRLTLYECHRTGERPLKAFMRWQADNGKSLAGPMRGTAGLTTGTVTALTKENYRLRYDKGDRALSKKLSRGPTTGAHIIYQMGSGVEVVKDSTTEADEHPLRRLRHAS